MDITEREPIPDLPPPAERRQLRERFNVTQRELADEIGVTRQAIMSWERLNNPANPTGDKRVRYARILAQWKERLASSK